MSSENPAKSSAQQESPHPAWTCVTCGQASSGEYCSHCGEKHRAGRDFSFLHLGAEALEAFFHLDSKVFLTLRTLVQHPGKLTSEFFRGRRKPYMAPLQLFLVCNLLFFILQPLTGLEILAPPLQSHLKNTYYGSVAGRLLDRQLAKQHISRDQKTEFEDYQERFYRVAHLQARSLVILMVPMFAVVLAVFFAGSRRYFIEHLVFSLHFYSWWLLWILAVLATGGMLLLGLHVMGLRLGSSALDRIGVSLEVGGFAVYLFCALREYQKVGRARALLTAALLGGLGFYIMHVYRFVLFFTTLYST